MRKADQNSDNKMSLKELKRFLLDINIEVDDAYAEMLFEVRMHSDLRKLLREAMLFGFPFAFN